MADHKQLLHELLKESQEPFRLKNYIAERRSQLKIPAQKAVLQIKKQRPIESASTCFTKPGSLCKHACFLSFQNSPDVRRSPFPSPLKSPCKSPRGGATVFLHVPSRTASMLVEAALRIQKQQQSKNNKAGFGLFGSLLKRLKDRSKNRKRALGNNELRLPKNHKHELERKIEENVQISCSCDNRAAELEASTSSYGYRSLEDMVGDEFISEDMLFCESPFRFSLRRSPSFSESAAGRTPEFCSPAASPRLPSTQEKENYNTKTPKEINGGEDHEEEKEHCSPVSILDPLFEDGNESGEEAEEDDHDHDHDHDCSSYANVQRAKQQLLYRLRRFEKLAGLDPVELERKMLDSSDEEFDQETVTEPDQDDLLSSHDTFLMSINTKSLVARPVVEEEGKIASAGAKGVVLGRFFNRSGPWKEVEFDTIDRMVEMDFKMDADGWNGFRELVEEITAEFELELLGLFVEELHGELSCMDHGCT